MRAQDGDQIRVLRASFVGSSSMEGVDSGGVGGDVVLGNLPDQGVADEDVVDQFIASPIFAAETLGFGDAQGARFHSRCRSPWSGWLKPCRFWSRSAR